MQRALRSHMPPEQARWTKWRRELSIAVPTGISGTWLRSQGQNGCSSDISRTVRLVGNRRRCRSKTFWLKAMVLNTRRYCGFSEKRE